MNIKDELGLKDNSEQLARPVDGTTKKGIGVMDRL
jgi:hypothetical protein